MINASLPYQNFTSGVMSGTSTITSSASNVMYSNTVGLQLQWTGVPQGTFQIQGSLDYNPGTPQSKGSYNAGTWTGIIVAPYSSADITIGSGSTKILANLADIGFPWIRVQYTNSTSSGVLTGYFCAKTQG